MFPRRREITSDCANNHRFTKLDATPSNALTSLVLTPTADNPVPKSVPCPPEEDPDGATSCPNTSSGIITKTTSSSSVTAATTTASATAAAATASAATTRLAVLADLLADLPAPDRRAVFAGLPLTDRASIAKLLVSPQA